MQRFNLKKELEGEEYRIKRRYHAEVSTGFHARR
jgi:hypothetical protein